MEKNIIHLLNPFFSAIITILYEEILCANFAEKIVQIQKIFWKKNKMKRKKVYSPDI